MARANIILILADEHRWDCAGYAGNCDVRTPNLDALARHGVTFSQAICQYPLCVPSRVTLMTGQYVHTHGVEGNRAGLPLTATTLPGVLHAAGYNTAAIGKMHFTPTFANYGFDIMQLAEQDGPGRLEDNYHAWLKDHGQSDDVDVWDQVDRDRAPQAYWDSFGAMTSNLPETSHCTTWIGDQAVRFLQLAREPFFLWMGFIKPHHPFDPPEPWDRLYDPAKLTLPDGWRLPVPEEDIRRGGYFDPRQMTEPKFRQVLAYYYASISHMDRQIGRVLATLTARGFTNNLIVYCADHGDYMGQHGLILKNEQPYEALLRVPLIFAGLTGQRRGETEPALAQLTDIVPTILDAAGLGVPPTVEGKTLVPALKQADVYVRDAALAQGPGGMRIARTLTHKLVQSPEFSALYDLVRDPYEFDNLYGRPDAAQVQSRLAQLL